MRLIKALLGVVLGLVALVAAALWLMPSERIAQIAAQQFQAATGRVLIVEGAVRPSFYPVIGASLGDIRVGNADWVADGTPLLRAQSVDVGLDLLALIRGDIQIEHVVIVGADLDLRRQADGRGNWEFDPPTGPGSASVPPETSEADTLRAARGFSLAQASLRDSRIRFRDAVAGLDVTLDDVSADLDMPVLDGPAELAVRATMNGQPLQARLRSDHAARTAEGAVTALVADIALAGARAEFSGRMGLDGLVLDGQIDATIPALRPLLSAIGQSGNELPAAYRPLALQGQITRTADGVIYARDARLRAGSIRLQGAADLHLDGPRPRLVGQLSGDDLDLRTPPGGSGGAGASAAGGVASDGWSRDVIDASALGLIDGTLNLGFNSIRTDALTVGRSRMDVTIDAARAVVDIREMALFEGNLTGQFIANNRSGLSVRADMRLRNIALLPFLAEVADYRRLQGTANLDVNLLGVGNSVHALMNSLRGEGSLRFDQGEIIGLDLAGMLRNLDLSYMGDGARTVYDSVTGRFTVQDGVLRNDDLLLQASRFSVTGRGTVGLGARVLDYRIVPAALRGEDGEALRVPLIITGPWDAPRFRLDMEALAREQLRVEQERLEELAREEARRLEDRARTEAAERLERELGVQREEGERVQDTLRRGLEEEVGRRLRGLLGGD